MIDEHIYSHVVLALDLLTRYNIIGLSKKKFDIFCVLLFDEAVDIIVFSVVLQQINVIKLV